MTTFYLVLSTFRIVSKGTNFGIISSALYHLQQIIIPSLLILHLSVFSPSATQNRTEHDALDLWLTAISPWKWFIENSTPLFTIMEGFCSLIFLQTAGRLSLWLIRTKGDSWIIAQLLASSCIFSSGMYFLYRIYTFPVLISMASATMIGVVLTSTVFVSLYGIISGRGNSIESSLLFAYIVYCLYFTFTDFQSTISASNFLYFFSSNKADIPPLPPFFINGYASLASSLAALVPAGFETMFRFLRGAVSNVTPSVFVSLAYRLGVFFTATRIVPAVHEVSHSRTASVSTLSDLDVVVKPVRDVQASLREQQAMDEDDEHEEILYSDDEDDDITVIQYDELDTTLLDEKLTYLSTTSAVKPLEDPLPHPTHSPRRKRSKVNSIQFLIFAYAPCILIAVYTHLLLGHLTLFNSGLSNSTGIDSKGSTILFYLRVAIPKMISPASATTDLQPVWSWMHGWANPRDSWQFWGWVNMFTTLALYTGELAFGQKTNREEVIEHHWNSD